MKTMYANNFAKDMDLATVEHRRTAPKGHLDFDGVRMGMSPITSSKMAF